jgi:hypothetical protein
MTANEFDHRRVDDPEQLVVPEPPQPDAEMSGAERLASAVGNEAFARVAARGAGILPDGRVHPVVESTIARTRGGGHTLDPATRERIGTRLGDSLADVRIHSDDAADALAASVSARAFTTGSDVYFARGEHQPGSSDGARLLAHELTHVAQQRDASSSGPLVVSDPGDALEVEAERSADELVG